jgi:hypothetical protein
MELLLDSLTNFKPKVLHCNICVITVSIFFFSNTQESCVSFILRRKKGVRENPQNNKDNTSTHPDTHGHNKPTQTNKQLPDTHRDNKPTHKRGVKDRVKQLGNTKVSVQSTRLCPCPSHPLDPITLLLRGPKLGCPAE